MIEADYNPRQLTEKQKSDLKKSISEFGFVEPIVINTTDDRKNVVIGGHQRLRIAKNLGFKEVPCVEVSLSLLAERELNIRLNKNSGDWDWDKLANEFDMVELVDWGFDPKEMGIYDDPEPKDITEKIATTYEIVVECSHEQEQEETFNKLTEMGLTCRVLTL